MFYKCRDKQRKHPCDDNRLAMIRARSEYKSACKKQRRGYETKQTKKLLHAKLNNIKEYWKLLSRNGNTKNSTRVTIDEFFNHFVSLSNPNGDFYVADDDVMSNMNALLNDDLCEMFQELNMPILDSEVIWAVKELKCGKSCGEDLVLNEFFIYGKDHLVEFITPLFNFILTVVIFRISCLMACWSLYINAAIIPLPTTSEESHCSVCLVNYSQESSTTALTNWLKHMVSISRHSLDSEVGEALLTVYMCCTCW